MNEWLPERLPEDIEAERSLLATCCAPDMGQAAIEVKFRLTEADFVHPVHKVIFGAMSRLVEANMEINPFTLKDTLDSAKDLSRIGDFAGLTEILSAEEVRDPHILADILIRKRKQRDLIRLGAQLVRKAASEEDMPETLVEQAGQELYRVAQGQDTRSLEHISDIFGETYENLLERLTNRGTSGLRVGFESLDRLTQGFQPGNLIVLAARPGIGKTSLALNWLMHATMKFGAHTAFFSLEMSKEEVRDRLLSSCAMVNLKAVARGEFDEATQHELIQARDKLIGQPIFICDRAAITTREIAAMVDNLCSRSNQKLDMVIVDYLQLLSSPLDSRGARQNEAVRIGEISRSLKILAKERGIPIVVLSQLNREIEHGQGRRPQLSDLRDSGAIEQDADMVIFIHRPVKKQITEIPEEQPNRYELIVAKHRNGPTGTIQLHFTGEHTLFREFDIVLS